MFMIECSQQVEKKVIVECYVFFIKFTRVSNDDP